MQHLVLFTCLFFSIFSFAAEVRVKIDLSPAGNFYAKTNEVSGQAKLSGAKITAENIVVNLKSLKTGIGLRDEHTQKKLETDKFPDAVLVKAEGTNGKGSGKIRIRGIEKDIAGTYEISDNILKANFKLKISDYQIKDVKYLGAGAKDEVKLEVEIPVTK